ncbi:MULTISPECIES: hypothetical protein [unclassified Nocardioides]|uniref:hypothetical protein n=1 Tax=unclassified Nocardioides TaxID=2615069 RepID=UPI0036176EB5
MGAAAGHVRMRELQRQGGVIVEDAITVTWIPGTHRPRIGHLRMPSPRGSSVLSPVVEALIRPSYRDPVPIVAEVLEGTGVDERILDELRTAVAPGGSVLLVLSIGADPDQARTAIARGLARGDVTMTYAVLAGDAVARLRTLVDAVSPVR